MTSTLDQPEKKVAAREAAETVSRSGAMAALIRAEITEDQVCILTFDRPDSAANIFDRATLEELHQHLDTITANSRLRGVILASAKKSIFIAGADPHSISQFTEPAQ